MGKKLIPVKIKNPSVSRRFANDKTNSELECDLDYENCQVQIVTVNQFVRGVVIIPTKNEAKIKFLSCDMIYSINNNGEIVERERFNDELLDHRFYVRFRYTKSLGAIDGYFSNQNIILYKKHRNKIYKLVSDLINSELSKGKYR